MVFWWVKRVGNKSLMKLGLNPFQQAQLKTYTTTAYPGATTLPTFHGYDSDMHIEKLNELRKGNVAILTLANGQVLAGELQKLQC